MTNNEKQNWAIVGGAILVALIILFLVTRTGNLTSGGNTGKNLVGQDLSSLQLFDKDGKPYSLASLKGQNVVLFFNEGLMCYPACWNQVAAFGLDPRFNSSSLAAISVVLDRSQDWQRAQARMPELAQARLLFDQSGAVSQQLGLLTLPSSMHRGRLPGHTYLVLDKNGVVRYTLDDPTMAINNDQIYQKILELPN